jgi:hypothetical protein
MQRSNDPCIIQDRGSWCARRLPIRRSRQRRCVARIAPQRPPRCATLKYMEELQGDGRAILERAEAMGAEELARLILALQALYSRRLDAAAPKAPPTIYYERRYTRCGKPNCQPCRDGEGHVPSGTPGGAREAGCARSTPAGATARGSGGAGLTGSIGRGEIA